MSEQSSDQQSTKETGRMPETSADQEETRPMTKRSKWLWRIAIRRAAGASGFASSKKRGEFMIKAVETSEGDAQTVGCPELRRQVREHLEIDRELEKNEVLEAVRRLKEKKKRIDDGKKKKKDAKK